jgi:hypothetical protein
MRIVCLAAVAGAVAVLTAGCGGSSEPSFPTIGAARTFQLESFRPAAKVQPGKPTVVSFRIVQPNGQTLTTYRRGAGPHTGIHLIFVRDDLGAIVHHHPKVGEDGTLDDTVTFPTPGRWRVVVDAYPEGTQQPNFQLFRWIDVAGKAPAATVPAFRATQDVDGYRFTLRGNPKVKAIQATTFDVDVTDPQGKPARFRTWFGATAHAIFFRKGDLAYYHTHICGQGATACLKSVAGGATVVGHSEKPGKLKVGVLLPEGGTWRMFLQTNVGGKVLTAPFTLQVAPA